METRCRLAKLWFNTGLAKWRFSAPQTHLWLIKVWFSASTFVVKIATFAKPETVIWNTCSRLRWSAFFGKFNSFSFLKSSVFHLLISKIKSENQYKLIHRGWLKNPKIKMLLSPRLKQTYVWGSWFCLSSIIWIFQNYYKGICSSETNLNYNFENGNVVVDFSLLTLKKYIPVLRFDISIGSSDTLLKV